MVKRHWSWIFIRKDGLCSMCEQSGVVYPANTLKTPCPTNNSVHLQAKHSVKEDSDATKTELAKLETIAKQPCIDTKIKAVASDQNFLDYMLLYAVPLERCEDRLFRLVHGTAPACRKVLRQRLLAHSGMRFKEALKKLAGRSVTIAVDGGTIWNKYLAIVALSYGVRPLVIRCVPCEERMTADWIANAVMSVIDLLREHNVLPLMYVADNASNMQSAANSLPLMPQRCLAHSIQLCVNDAFSLEPYSTVWTTVKALLRENNLSEPPLTRWSGKYLSMTKLMQGNYTVGSVNTDEYQALLPASRALKSFYTATQIVQANNATIVSAAAVIHSLLNLRPSGARDTYTRALSAATANRKEFLITDAVLVIAFFHPGTKRGALDASVKDHVWKIVRTVFKVIAGDAVMNEWTRMRIAPPRPVDSMNIINTKSYVSYWADQSNVYPAIAHAVTRIAELNPTEAECERAFSSCKFAFPRLRASSGGDLVEATVVGNSAVAFNFDHVFENEVREIVDADEEPQVDATLTGKDALNLIEAWSTFNAPGIERHERRQRRDNGNCGECGKGEDDHLPDAKWVRCAACTIWFAFECVGINPEDEALVRAQESWNCNDCLNHHVRPLDNV